MALFTIGYIKSYLKRFAEANPNLSLKLGIVTVNFPYGREKGAITPTRKGINIADKNSPFVQSDIEKLIYCYSDYKTSKEYKLYKVPYAESIPLKNGIDGFEFGTDINDLSIKVINYQYTPNPDIKAHYDASINLFKEIKKIRKNLTTGQWENNKTTRIHNWNQKTNIITIQPASYFDQVATNLTLDWASGLIKGNHNATLRNNIEKSENNKLSPLNTSVLANTLGVAVMVINPTTGEILIPIRGDEQAIMFSGKGQFHCSASGVFEWPEQVKDNDKLNFDIFLEGMQKEIHAEIGLHQDEYKLIPLAFSRELVRGGKPQLFFVAETQLNISTIKKNMKNAPDSWEFIHPESLKQNSKLFPYLTAPEKAPDEMYTYEGMMAMRILLAYVEKKEPPFKMCD